MGKTAKRHPTAVEFGRRLREARKAKGWTQERLAEAADVHDTYVGSVERGERNVSLLNIVKLGVALGVAPGSLVPEE